MDASENLRGHPNPQPLSGAFGTVFLREQIVRALREAVLSGVLVPGRLYSARSLAAQLGVSLTPVRGAVLQLVNAGLMEQQPNRGFRVCGYSRTDRAHLVELLMLLEREAIGAIAGSPSPATEALERSTAAGLAAARAGDVQGFLECEEEFHHSLCVNTGNYTLVRTALDLRERVRLHDLAHRPSARELSVRAMEHRLLLQLLRQRQWTPAGTLLERHLRGKEQADALGA